MSHTPGLTIEQVRHVAVLSRLAIPDEALADRVNDLSAILAHVAALQKVDVSGIAPLSQPGHVTNRLADDVPQPGLDRGTFLAGAPSIEDVFVAVPKVLDEGGG